MTDTPRLPDREQMRHWLENWNAVGAVLESERLTRLSRMTDEEARELTCQLLALWRPSELDAMGEELVAHQRWFMTAARTARRR